MTAQKHTLPTTRTLASPQAIAAHRQALSATGAMSVNLFMLSGVLTDLKVHPGLRLMELRFELTDAASREAYNAREGSHADSNRTIFAHARIYDPAPMADAQTLVRGEPFHMLGFLEFFTKKRQFGNASQFTVLRVTQILRPDADVAKIASEMGLNLKANTFAELRDEIQRAALRKAYEIHGASGTGKV